MDQDIVNMKDNHGDTPLHEACIRGEVGIVKDLLKHGADPDAKNYDGINPLGIACMTNHVIVVQAILDYNLESKELKLTHVKWSENVPMHSAAEDDVMGVELALHPSVPIKRSKHIVTHTAAEEVAHVIKSENVKTHSAAEDDVAMGEELAVYPCGMKDAAEVEPIHIVAEQGNIDIARELLDRDESCKDLFDEQHRSPLHYAARSNQVELIKLLLHKWDMQFK